MKIALIGHGKMGRMIEEIAKERGHEISVIVDVDNSADIDSKAFRKSDVAIEFTRPDSAVNNILKCFSASVPVVCGTTGWQDSMAAVRALCDAGKGTLFYSTNFSIGVNIFEAVNRYLAKIMNGFPQYKASEEEVHHVHKLDHPSGTAITIAEELIAASDRYGSWKEPEEGVKEEEGVFYISHRREGEVPGIHTVTWDSPQDTITISHSAKSREGFALGAVLAAEWLCEKTRRKGIGPVKFGSAHRGFYSMPDMLQL